MSKEVKEVSELDQILIDTIQKATAVTGEAIDGAKKVTGQAIDFASAQIPDVVHQLLVWKLTECIVLAVLYSTLILLFFIILPKVKAVSKKWNDIGPTLFYLIFGGTLLVVLPGFGLVFNVLEAIKISVAPKLYLLEYVAKLIK